MTDTILIALLVLLAISILLFLDSYRRRQKAFMLKVEINHAVQKELYQSILADITGLKDSGTLTNTQFLEIMVLLTQFEKWVEQRFEEMTK